MAATTVTETAATPRPSARISGERRLLIPRISWDAYVAFGDDLARQGNGSVHLTYDRGRMEIMTTGAPHEWYKEMLGNLFVILAYELDVSYRSGGSMTFRRRDLDRGLEPDECWWIAHERELRGRDDYDSHSDPPPDLAVEIEISNPLLDKLDIYAELGIPEIWRFDGEQLRFWQRQPDGQYQRSQSSLAFPFLRPEHLQPHLQIQEDLDDGTRVKRFAQWLRERDAK